MFSIAQMNNPEPLQAGEPVQIDELLKAFLSGRSPCTLKAYRQDLVDFQSFARTNDVEAAARVLISQGHGQANLLLLKYRTHLVERGLQSATVIFAQLTQLAGCTIRNPCRSLKTWHCRRSV
jgi:hypothetical protein